MKILITGTAGFIGFHLAKSLLRDSFDVLGIDSISDYYDIKLKKDRLLKLKKSKNFIFKKINISNKESLNKVYESYLPDIVVNLAAQPGVSYSMKNPYSYVDSNLVGFVNIIECARKFKTQGFIYASSSSVYGLNEKKPFSEDDRVNKPIALYGATKRANELIASSYSHLYGLHTTGLRYFTVYGPWYRPDMAMFIFAKKIMDKKPIDIYNNGNIKRDFTYIDDIINGTKLSLMKNYNCEIFNLGNNKTEKLMDIIKIIEKELGVSAKLNLLPAKSGDMIETFADINYSKDMLGYNPEMSVNDGVPRFVKWFKEYYK